ncbi:MAG: DUF1611 domain-containing protein [Alphaproteobacteria bacterium]|jgi:hypothetical protein|nr:DUF1611 domain-containing protein [Alphaproteobacteria bacterium]
MLDAGLPANIEISAKDPIGAECTVPLSAARIASAKRAFTTRNIDFSDATRLLTANTYPEIGDLVLARVVRTGQHRRIELPCGRRSTMHVGDEIVVAFGARYASDQFEAGLPVQLGACHLVAAGGVAASAYCKHSRMKNPTEIATIGILATADGRKLNMRDFAIPGAPLPKNRPPVTIVLGTAMNAGKTAAVASLVKSGCASGLKVGVAKATGTGSGGDLWSAIDAGAAAALDFSDAGHPSTHQIGPDAIEQCLATLTHALTEQNVDHIVVEIADGLLFGETATLVSSATFNKIADRIILAAGDAMGAVASENTLAQLGYQAEALTGLFTAAPLAMNEVAGVTDTPVIHTDELSIHFDRPEAAAQ